MSSPLANDHDDAGNDADKNQDGDHDPCYGDPCAVLPVASSGHGFTDLIHILVASCLCHVHGAGFAAAFSQQGAGRVHETSGHSPIDAASIDESGPIIHLIVLLDAILARFFESRWVRLNRC